jgi:hypothetical protein
MVGQQIARSGYITVAQYLTAVPWVFTVQPHQYLYYPQVRDVIQTIDNLDRQLPQNIFFQSSNLAWFLEYQGDIPTASFSTVVLATTPTANTQILSVTVPTGTGYAFKAGDFINVDGYTYKVTEDVLRSSSPVNVGIHRPLIGLPPSGTRVYIGNDCVFRVVAETCPTYTLNPMTDGAYVQWDNAFVFREYIV